jgi:hypothetical protein
MATTKRYLGRVITFLLSIVVTAHLTLVQRFYPSSSDTGQQWAALAAWFELRAWLVRETQTPRASWPRTESEQLASFRVARAGDLRSTGVR